MKKIYTLASLIGLTSLTFGQAQLPNTSLDNWETETFETETYEEPTSWAAGEICGSISIGRGTNSANCSVAATKSTESNSGSFSAKVVDDGAFGLNILDYAFTDAPTSMELKLKKSLLTGDKARIRVYLQNGSIFDKHSIIGEGDVDVTGTSSVFETFTVNIDYTGNKASINQISVIIEVTEEGETTNSSILVDDFKLNYGAVGIAEKTSVKTISINPNPASDVISFNEELAQFDILNINGEVIVSGNNSDNISISSLQKGMYILKGTNQNGELVASRFVKQ